MFERFTEKARRTVFFARFEASNFASPYIEVEHLLLGLLRESPYVRQLLPAGATEALREKITNERGVGKTPIATSVDLPLSVDAKRMLSYAADEASVPDQRHIDCEHLFIGLLRLPPSLAHDFLRDQAGDLQQLLTKVRYHLEKEALRPEQSARLTHLFVPADEFLPLHRSLSGMVRHASESMNCYTEAFGNTKLHRLPWTRKQALGKLINWAGQYHLWLAQALIEPSLHADRFPSDEYLVAQRYQEMPWKFVVESWFNMNGLLLNAIAVLPATKASLPCRIGLDEPVPLEKLILGFIDMTEDILGQVLAQV